jgi:hypothetical protein
MMMIHHERERERERAEGCSVGYRVKASHPEKAFRWRVIVFVIIIIIHRFNRGAESFGF